VKETSPDTWAGRGGKKIPDTLTGLIDVSTLLPFYILSQDEMQIVLENSESLKMAGDYNQTLTRYQRAGFNIHSIRKIIRKKS
jgi:hypothetical protein